MLTPAQALRRVLDGVAPLSPLPPERVFLPAALGRALAEDLRAERPLPPFDNSQMDGFALRAADARKPGARLPVAFAIYAGDRPDRALPRGACARIFTGAPLPEGADCVEMQEEVRADGEAAIFRRAAEKGRFVRRAGLDVAVGAVALRRGTVVDPGAIGLAAALGRTELAVVRRPRVAILATGDEIAPVDRPPRPGAIADSNSHALAAACREAGAEPTLLPVAADRPESIRAAVAGARGCDALVTIGGVSVGDKDFVKAALTRAGTRFDVGLEDSKVAMRPGKPIAFGRLGKTAAFGLPGNPASALVTFELFVRPALRALAGLPGSGRLTLAGRLARAVDKPTGLTVYLRSRATLRAGELLLEPLGTQVSGHLSSVTGFEALAVLPPKPARLAKGARVEAILVSTPREG